MEKKELAQKMQFKPLKWTDYEKLDTKARESYGKQESEYNFNRKMQRKYGNSVERGTKKLSKFFG